MLETPQGLQTARLILRPMSRHHQDALHQLHASQAVMAAVGGPYDHTTSMAKIAEAEAHWLTHGFGLWCWFLKATNTFIGRGGLRWQSLDSGVKQVELAYMLHTAYWGQGYASEVAQYSLDYGFNRLHCTNIIALTRPNNKKSQQVMVRAGFSLQSDPVLFRDKPHIIGRIEK